MKNNIAVRLGKCALDGIPVGDSGCAERAYLLTLILKPKNAREVGYNIPHRRTRRVNERCFGLLKRRCFSYSALGTSHRLDEYPRHYSGHCSVGIKKDLDEDIENENVPYDIVAAADEDSNPKLLLNISRYFA